MSAESKRRFLEMIRNKKKKGGEKEKEKSSKGKKQDYVKPSSGFMKKFGLVK